MYAGPYATVLAGNSVTGTARIEDQAISANGAVSGGTVGGLSVIGNTGSNGNNRFIVGGGAQVRTSFYPLGFVEAAQAASGTLNLYGDVEYRGNGLNLSAGNRAGFVDATSTVGRASDINTRVRPLWRP